MGDASHKSLPWVEKVKIRVWVASKGEVLRRLGCAHKTLGCYTYRAQAIHGSYSTHRNTGCEYGKWKSFGS